MGGTMMQRSSLLILFMIISSINININILKIEKAAAQGTDGFTTDLIHRDSPESPYYDPSSTPSQRLAAAVQHSNLRAKHFNDTLLHMIKKDADSIITYAAGSYFMRFGVGSPPKTIVAIADTGSHITWTQCLSCTKCFPQTLPIFDPKLSKTYKDIRCSSYICNEYSPYTYCDQRRQKCLYSASYGDGTRSRGVIATEVFYFKSSKGVLNFSHIPLGCGHDNILEGGIDKNNTPSGIVGLAGGRASLVRQLGYDKFAYCLMPFHEVSKTSKLHFGGDAVVSGRGVVSTPLTIRKRNYLLELEAISVGNERILFYNPYLVDGGNILIDSGTTITYFPLSFYDQLEGAIKRSIKEPVRQYKQLRLCYTRKFSIPKITVHFKGADVEWKFDNAFVKVNKDYVCLACRPGEGSPIYGSIAQANYLVGYDLGKKTVSFKQTICGT